MKGFTESFFIEVIMLMFAFALIYYLFSYFTNYLNQNSSGDAVSFILSKSKNCYGDCYYGPVNFKNVNINKLKEQGIVVLRYEKEPNMLKIRKDKDIYVYLWRE